MNNSSQECFSGDDKKFITPAFVGFSLVVTLLLVFLIIAKNYLIIFKIIDHVLYFKVYVVSQIAQVCSLMMAVYFSMIKKSPQKPIFLALLFGLLAFFTQNFSPVSSGAIPVIVSILPMIICLCLFPAFLVLRRYFKNQAK